MKNITKLLFVFLLLVGFSVPATRPAAAFELRSGESVTVGSKETVNGTLLTSGNSINIEGKVDGDLICAGKSIKITGQVTGDIICAGQEINITNNTLGNLRLAGQNINIQAQVAKNITLVGQNITIDPKTAISGEVLCASQKTSLSGLITKNIKCWAESFNLNAKVGGDVDLQVASLEVGQNALVSGNLNYQSRDKLSDTTKVRGQAKYAPITKWDKTPLVDSQSVKNALSILSGFVKVALFSATMIAGLILTLLFPNFFSQSSQTIQKSFGHSLKWGLLISLLTTILVIFLAVSLIGIPLLFLLHPLLLLGLLVAQVVSAVFVGRVLKEDSSVHLAFIIGLIIIFIFTQIPLIGGLLSLVFTSVGLGAVYLAWRQR